MEANEASELQEHAEHGAHESAMRPVAFTMSLLAVMVAVATVLGHRTHTEAIIAQTRAAVEQNRVSDMWNFYQAKKIRSNDTGLASDLLADLSPANKDKTAKDLKSYADHQAKWNDDLKEEEKRAHEEEDKVKEFEKEVALAEKRAARFDFGEALLEIGLVVTSVTLLTRSRIYWYFGMAFAAAGIISAVTAFLVH
jgi:Domain of unknown function (DUF4337)